MMLPRKEWPAKDYFSVVHSLYYRRKALAAFLFLLLTPPCQAINFSENSGSLELVRFKIASRRKGKDKG